jgi:hypothetical protein
MYQLNSLKITKIMDLVNEKKYLTDHTLEDTIKEMEKENEELKQNNKQLLNRIIMN